MSMLLDTSVLLRLVTDNPHIGESFKQAVESGLDNGDVAVSAVTFMETTLLHHHRRIDLGCHPATWRVERLMSGLLEIPIDGDLAVESVLLMNSGFHRDPADQLIVATAMRTGMELATFDAEIQDWASRTRLIALRDPTR